MLINEIFQSINGEGQFCGYPTIFIRTFGCDLRCSYCDTMYAVKGRDFKEMSLDEILSEVKKFNCKRITLTGGEPLLQKDALDLINTLVEDDYIVEIETNGAVDLTNYVGHNDVFITMDWKCPSSGMLDKMLEDNLQLLQQTDTLKFVVGSKEDLDEMREVSQRTAAQCFASPVFGKIEPKEIVEYMLENNLDNIKAQIQLHKVIYDPEERGV